MLRFVVKIVCVGGNMYTRVGADYSTISLIDLVYFWYKDASIYFPYCVLNFQVNILNSF